MQYKLDSGKIITIKDFFRKAAIEGNAKDAIIEYTYHELDEGDRPDVVATKLYGNGDLHWTFFLVNDFTNYYDWYKDIKTFESYMDYKYRGKYFVASDSTDLVSSSSKFLIGETITGTGSTGTILAVEPTYKRIAVDVDEGFTTPILSTGSSSSKAFTPSSVIDMKDGVNHYYLGDLKRNTFAAGYTAKSHWEHEWETNEAKRKIKIIKPSRIGQVVRQFEKVMKS